MLQLNQVTKRYKSKLALSNINLELQAGELIFLTGHSGAGKSSLLKLIALLERVNGGKITLFGDCINEIPNRSIPFFRRKFGLIFQDPNLLPNRNVFNNVALPLVISGCPYREMGRKVRAALDKVSLLHKENSYPHELSSGEQQRVSIARAIVNKPPLLLADEPTGNLDPQLAKEIFHLFCQLNQVGVSAIIASHDLGLINKLPFRKVTLNQGRVVNE